MENIILKDISWDATGDITRRAPFSGETVAITAGANSLGGMAGITRKGNSWDAMVTTIRKVRFLGGTVVTIQQARS